MLTRIPAPDLKRKIHHAIQRPLMLHALAQFAVERSSNWFYGVSDILIPAKFAHPRFASARPNGHMLKGSIRGAENGDLIDTNSRVAYITCRESIATEEFNECRKPVITSFKIIWPKMRFVTGRLPPVRVSNCIANAIVPPRFFASKILILQRCVEHWKIFL